MIETALAFLMFLGRRRHVAYYRERYGKVGYDFNEHLYWLNQAREARMRIGGE